jgi:hypothetical protein
MSSSNNNKTILNKPNKVKILRPNYETIAVSKTEPDYSSELGTHIQWNGVHRSVTTTPEQVSAAENNHVFVDTAETLDIVSTSADDTAASSGIGLLVLFGLDDNFDPISENVFTNGLTPVTTTNLFRRLNQVVIGLNGATAATQVAVAAGDITIAGSIDNWATIFAGKSSCPIGHYTPPRGHTFIAQSLLFFTQKDGDMTIKFYANPGGVPFQNILELPLFQTNFYYEGLRFKFPGASTLFLTGETRSGGQARELSIVVNGICYPDNVIDEWTNIT